MNEYFISSVTSNLPKTKRNQELFETFKVYEYYLLTEESEQDFNIFLEAYVEYLNDTSSRAIPLEVIRNSFNDDISYTVRGGNPEQGLYIMLRGVKSRYIPVREQEGE